jgi:hypothetical protein
MLGKLDSSTVVSAQTSSSAFISSSVWLLYTQAGAEVACTRLDYNARQRRQRRQGSKLGVRAQALAAELSRKQVGSWDTDTGAGS